MAQSAAHDFLQVLDKDPAMKEQLRAEEAAAKDFFASAAAFAASRGFAFTADEFAAELRATGWELRDDDLDKVAGGLTPIQMPRVMGDGTGPIRRIRTIDD
ncbi:MAG TPA: Nif11-like leader peptide family RiPP precursor [Thermoanaerobaculaceae bacterium]|nr:Nif11-like leader peptide family RiPP precursor [Thermoanaerobaculaceae bacterium]